MGSAIKEELIKNAGEALKYDGFNLGEWIKVNTYKIKAGLEAKPLSFKEANLTLNDTHSVCVQIGLMRGNSTREKLINPTAEEGRAFMTDILNFTKHLGRSPTSKKKYSRTEFTFLRCITAFPHFACAILDKLRNDLSNNDPYFETHTLPWALQHGSSYALTHTIPGISNRD